MLHRRVSRMVDHRPVMTSRGLEARLSGSKLVLPLQCKGRALRVIDAEEYYLMIHHREPKDWSTHTF